MILACTMLIGQIFLAGLIDCILLSTPISHDSHKKK